MPLFDLGFIDFLVILIASVILLFAIDGMVRVFAPERKTTRLILVLSYLLYLLGGMVAAAFFAFFENLDILVVAIELALLFVILLNYKASMKKRIVALICIYSANIATIMGTSILFNHIFHDPTAAKIVFGASLVFYFVAMLVQRLKNIRKSPVVALAALVMPIATFAMLFLSRAGITDITFLSVLIVLVIANILTFYLLDTLSARREEKIKLALYAQEAEYFLAQCELAQKSVEQVNAVRHDMRLHLTVLKECAADNKTATDYLDRLLGDVEKSKVYSDTGNIAFDSIINSTLGHGEADIQYDIRLAVPPALNMDIADIVIILGNLLNNALDAVRAVDDKRIKLHVEFSKGTLLIQVENTFNGEVKHAESVIIASQKGGEEHGHGLKNIQNAVDKYSGNLDISHDETTFSVGVLLYLDDSK